MELPPSWKPVVGDELAKSYFLELCRSLAGILVGALEEIDRVPATQDYRLRNVDRAKVLPGLARSLLATDQDLGTQADCTDDLQHGAQNELAPRGAPCDLDGESQQSREPAERTIPRRGEQLFDERLRPGRVLFLLRHRLRTHRERLGGSGRRRKRRIGHACAPGSSGQDSMHAGALHDGLDPVGSTTCRGCARARV